MPENRKDGEFDWIEFAAGVGRLIGLNPVRTRWKLRAWREKIRNEGRIIHNRGREVTRRHKSCPRCRALNAMEDKVCAHCGARLRSRPLEMADRFLRHFSLGLSAETFLAAAFIIVYLTAIVTAQSPSLFSISGERLAVMGADLASADQRLPKPFFGFRLEGYPSTIHGQWWRLLTSVFLHANLIHLIFNIYALLYIAPLVREIFGQNKLLFAFLMTGLAASAVSLYWHLAFKGGVSSVGASGAVSGLIGLMLAWGHLDKTPSGVEIRNNMARWVFYIVIFGLLVGRVDNAGHLGGLAAGVVMALFMKTSLWGKESAAWRAIGAGSAATLLAAAGLIVWLAFTAPRLAG